MYLYAITAKLAMMCPLRLISINYGNSYISGDISRIFYFIQARDKLSAENAAICCSYVCNNCERQDIHDIREFTYALPLIPVNILCTIIIAS